MKDSSNFVYDRTLRELFQTVPTALIKMLVKRDIKEILDISFPKIEERRVDLLARLDNDELFHLEIQSTNCPNMPARMLNYASLIYLTYNEFPKQLVLYVGDRDIKIENGVNFENIRYNYEVKSIKEFDCSILIESDNISDNIIAVLCDIKDIDKLFNRLKEKLLKLDNKKREDYLRKLFYLLRLRPNLKEKLKEKNQEELPMPFIIEKERDPLYKDGLHAGIKQGMKKGLEQGLEQGNYQARLNIAKRALKNGIDIETIIMLTNLSKDEILNLKAQDS